MRRHLYFNGRTFPFRILQLVNYMLFRLNVYLIKFLQEYKLCYVNFYTWRLEIICIYFGGIAFLSPTHALTEIKGKTTTKKRRGMQNEFFLPFQSA